MTSNGKVDEEFKAIGKSPLRHDGVDKVTGKALYGSDIRLPGMIYGKVLRSPYAHARIRSIDTSKAEAHPEVLAVATSRDFAPVADMLTSVGEEVYTSLKYVRDNILADDKVFYEGHAIAAIAAASPHVAEEALQLIEVEYEVLPSAITVEDAMQPDAPVLHEHLTAFSFGDEPPTGTNVASHQQFKLGDLEQGLQQADLVLEREYRTKTVHQGYIEPQNGTAWWTPGGQLTIWCSSQTPFGIRDTTARVLGVPVSNVRVVPLEIGGGFGGKLTPYLEPIAVVLSRKSGRPVKMAMSRTEVLKATGPTSGTYIKVKIGVTKGGRITAAQAYLAFEAGAFPGSPLGGAVACMFSPYKIENLQIDGYDVVTNKPKTSAYRAPGAPMGAFAVESLVDEICERLALDPVDFRILNAAQKGTRRANGTVNPVIGMLDTARTVKGHPHYLTRLKGKNRGRGVAFGFWANGTGPSSVAANVMPDGTVSLVLGSIDIGGSRVALAQQLAEALGISAEEVKPAVVDTDTIGFTSSTAGSSVTFKTGWAVYEAAQDLKQQLVERAAILWGSSPEQIEYCNGMLKHREDPNLGITLKELASRLNDLGGPVQGRGEVNPRGVGGSYSANIVDVEVDPDTGKVTVLRYTAFQDAGKAIHPQYVEGQIQGGTVQGIGWALNEEYFMSTEGKLLNASFLDYRMPTSLDTPMIEAVIVEVPNPGHPFGVRGVGEASIVPPLAAIANAIYNAVGVRMRELPMSPGAILKALQEKSRQKVTYSV